MGEHFCRWRDVKEDRCAGSWADAQMAKKKRSSGESTSPAVPRERAGNRREVPGEIEEGDGEKRRSAYEEGGSRRPKRRFGIVKARKQRRSRRSAQEEVIACDRGAGHQGK